MKNKNIITVILIALIILIILGLLISFKINDLKEANTVNVIDENNITQENTEKITDYNTFYTIETCIQKYETLLHLDYEKQLNELNQPSIAAMYGIDSETGKANALLELLDIEYINEDDINVDNIFSILGQYKDNVEVKVLEINKLDSSNSRISAYSVYVQVTSEDKVEKVNKLYIIRLDNVNNTFSIYPINDQVFKSIDEINVTNKVELIEKKQNNTFVFMQYNDSQIATRYFQEYKNLILNDARGAYDKLDEEYRNKRFGNVDNFIKYVNENKKDIQSSQIMKYQSNENDSYKEFVCMKLDKTYWIIRETAPSQYTVILDTYTIDLPQFIEKYNSSSDAEKVVFNIQRIFEAINDGDYKYAYSKLDSTFAQANFPTQADFENYVKQNFYKNSSIEYNNYKTSGDLFIYDINIKDKDNESNPVKNKNFIMQLKEGTDFVMSFNVK